jgi:hypothetical protein
MNSLVVCPPRWPTSTHCAVVLIFADILAVPTSRTRSSSALLLAGLLLVRVACPLSSLLAYLSYALLVLIFADILAVRTSQTRCLSALFLAGLLLERVACRLSSLAYLYALLVRPPSRRLTSERVACPPSSSSLAYFLYALLVRPPSRRLTSCTHCSSALLAGLLLRAACLA